MNGSVSGTAAIALRGKQRIHIWGPATQKTALGVFSQVKETHNTAMSLVIHLG